MKDPTYVRSQIDANPEWKLAFRLSEVDNDNAPIGWYRYAILARWLLQTFTIEEKSQPNERGNALVGAVNLIAVMAVTIGLGIGLYAFATQEDAHVPRCDYTELNLVPVTDAEYPAWRVYCGDVLVAIALD